MLGQAGSYRAVKVKCPHHHECGRKSRTFGHRDAKKSGLGDNEAYAFLGCWMRMGATMDAQAHKQLKLDQAAVLAYARELGWSPSAQL